MTTQTRQLTTHCLVSSVLHILLLYDVHVAVCLYVPWLAHALAALIIIHLSTCLLVLHLPAFNLYTL
jgi:hypothetical protein